MQPTCWQRAEQGLRTYARLVQETDHVIPVAVVHDLMVGDHAPVIDPTVVEHCRATVDSIWKSTTA